MSKVPHEAYNVAVVNAENNRINVYFLINIKSRFAKVRNSEANGNEAQAREMHLPAMPWLYS